MISEVEGVLPRSGRLNLDKVTAAGRSAEMGIWYTTFAGAVSLSRPLSQPWDRWVT